MSAIERAEELKEFFYQIDSPLFQAQLCAWIRNYIDAKNEYVNEICKQENEKLISQNNSLKQEMFIYEQNSEKMNRDIAALQETIEQIHNSGSWKFGHGIALFFRKFYKKSENNIR